MQIYRVTQSMPSLEMLEQLKKNQSKCLGDDL